MTHRHILFVFTCAPLLFSGCLAVDSGEPKPAPFNYETATPEEQTEWLTKEADELARGFRRGINSSFDKFEVEPPAVNVRRRTIKITAQSTRNNKLNFPIGQKNKLQTIICEDYVRSKLRKQKIVSTFVIKRPNGSIALTLKDGDVACRPFVKIPTE